MDVEEAEAKGRRVKGSATGEEAEEADFNLRAANAPRDAMIKDDICCGLQIKHCQSLSNAVWVEKGKFSEMQWPW